MITRLVSCVSVAFTKIPSPRVQIDGDGFHLPAIVAGEIVVEKRFAEIEFANAVGFELEEGHGVDCSSEMLLVISKRRASVAMKAASMRSSASPRV